MKTKTIVFTIAAAALCLSGIFSVTGCKKEESKTLQVTSVKFDSDSRTVNVGGTISLSVIISPEGAQYQNISVTSSDSTIAKATLSGTTVSVKGIKTGKVDVTVTVDSFHATCSVTVKDEEYIVSLIYDSIEVVKGDSCSLYALVIPSEGADVEWTSRNADVAEVVESAEDQFEGVVYGHEIGATYIICTVNGKFVDSCYVAVAPKDLSKTGTANCYIVSEAGFYKFKATKGNSTDTIQGIDSVAVLWETFGTAATPTAGDLIPDSTLAYENGYVYFATGGQFSTKGNAVIAAYKNNVIQWSWHIWMTDKPADQTYNDHTFLDRNLGATDTAKGNVAAFGLFYQWGRKDPFLGASVVSGTDSTKKASSTITWPNNHQVEGTSQLNYSISHPTTFINGYHGSNDYFDWYAKQQHDNDLWGGISSVKTIYDPCPVGYCVPDSSAWNNFDTSNFKWDDSKYGRTYTSGAVSAWYPSTGYLSANDGKINRSKTPTGSSTTYRYIGQCWSCIGGYDASSTSTTNQRAYGLYFYEKGVAKNYLEISSYGNQQNSRARGESVRCVKITE